MRNIQKLGILILLFTYCTISPVLGQSNQNATSGVLSINNGFYEVLVDAATGIYTARTSTQHPAGTGLSVLYAQPGPQTSFNTIRSYTSNTDYTQTSNTSDASGFQAVALSNFAPQSEVIDGNAIRTRYVLDPSAPDSMAKDAMEIIQDIRVIGHNQFTSAVQVTTRITNTGSSRLQVGVRYLWDFEIGLDDGPAFATKNPDSTNINAEVEYSAPDFSYFQIQDNDQNATSPILSVLGTVKNQGSFNPPATAPTLLRNACWVDASVTSFEYTINPARDINTTNSDCRGQSGGDGAVLYYFGHNQQTAYTLTDSETKSISAYIFLTPPPPVDTTDTDGDGLLDTWEINGIDLDNDGIVDVKLEGVNYQRKDILIYYDWTEYVEKDADGNVISTITNNPQTESIDRVIAAFANAPITNPDNSKGISIHFVKGNAVDDGKDRTLGTWDGWYYSWQEFADIKASSFPAELWPFYHYVIFASRHVNDDNGSSGRSRNSEEGNFSAGASDFIVSIGSWNQTGENKIRIEASTIMHELGHNLGLGHGGVNVSTDEHGEKIVTSNHANGKPNHLSIMSYSFQTQGIPVNDTRIIDYSRFNSTDLPTLNETALNETSWLGATTTQDGATVLLNPQLAGYSTRYYCPTSRNEFELKVADVANTIDWNCDNEIATAPITANIDGSNRTTHTTENEWENIVYNGGAIGALGAALDLPLTTNTRLSPEPTRLQHEALLNNVFVAFESALLINGSFEAPETAEIGTSLQVADNSVLNGWVLADGDVELINASLWQPAAGQRSLELNGSGRGAIQQSIPTEVGQLYTVRFAFSGAPGTAPAEKAMRVEVVGSQSENFQFSVDSSGFTPENMHWEYKTLSFVATDPVTVITFRSETDGDAGPLIDDVSVTGKCFANVSLASELISAIEAANTGQGCQYIYLNANITLSQLEASFAGGYGENAFPIITSAITIDGNGFVISRENTDSNFRFFEVNGRDGNHGNLTLRNIQLIGANTQDGGAVIVDGSRGGNASVTIDRVDFRENRSDGNGGALTLLGFNGGHVTATISDSIFTDNHGRYGGAIYVGGFDNGSVTAHITDTIFSVNTSINGGGAIFNNGQGSGAHVDTTIDSSRFTANQAGGSGGAIINVGIREGNAKLRLNGVEFLNNTGAQGTAISSDGSENGFAQVEWSNGGAASNGMICFNSDASGSLVQDETCGVSQ